MRLYIIPYRFAFPFTPQRDILKNSFWHEDVNTHIFKEEKALLKSSFLGKMYTLLIERDFMMYSLIKQDNNNLA